MIGAQEMLIPLFLKIIDLKLIISKFGVMENTVVQENCNKTTTENLTLKYQWVLICLQAFLKCKSKNMITITRAALRKHANGSAMFKIRPQEKLIYKT